MAPTGYPKHLTARPLLLPVGAIEGGAELHWIRIGASPDSTSTVTAEPRVRYSAPGVELEARVGIALYQTDPDLPGVTVEIERLAWIAGMARARLDDDTAIGADFIANTPSADYSSQLGRLFAVTKRHLSPRSAVELEGFVGATRASQPMGDSETTGTGGGELRVMAQVNDVVGVIGRGALALQKLRYGSEGTDEYFVNGTYGVRAVAAVSPNIDLVAGIDVLNTQYSVVEMTVGIVARSVP
jgi:hypothetical protein